MNSHSNFIKTLKILRINKKINSHSLFIKTLNYNKINFKIKILITNYHFLINNFQMLWIEWINKISK